MRRTPGKAQAFAERVPGSGQCQGYDNLQAFLQHDGMDAVYISTRPGTHLEIAQQVAAAGKACYIEKPFGRCAAETQQIVDLFRQAKLPLYAAYISRAYDRTQAVRKLLQEGAIGDKLRMVNYELVGLGGARDMGGALPWRLDASQSGGGLIMDVGCHIVDRIDYLCGPLVDVNGSAKNKASPNQPVEDYVEFTAKIGPSSWASFPGCEGAEVSCRWDFSPKGSMDEIDRLEFVGSKGTIRLKGMSPSDPVHVLDTNGKLVQELTFEAPEHTAQQLIQAVTLDLLNSNYDETGDPMLSKGGANAVRTQQVLDACLTSYYGGREAGYWTRQSSWPGRPSA